MTDVNVSRNGTDSNEDSPAVDAPPASVNRLLAVDDVSDSAELVARVAKRCGYDARHTTDPTTVRDLVRSWRPTLLVTDICMPTMDAIELFKVLDEAGFKGEVFIVSGQDNLVHHQTSKLAVLHGVKVVGSMRKPIDIHELRDFLKGRLEAA